MDLKQYNLSYELCCNIFDFIMAEINRVGFARQGLVTDKTKFKKIFLIRIVNLIIKEKHTSLEKMKKSTQ